MKESINGFEEKFRNEETKTVSEGLKQLILKMIAKDQN